MNDTKHPQTEDAANPVVLRCAGPAARSAGTITRAGGVGNRRDAVIAEGHRRPRRPSPPPGGQGQVGARHRTGRSCADRPRRARIDAANPNRSWHQARTPFRQREAASQHRDLHARSNGAAGGWAAAARLPALARPRSGIREYGASLLEHIELGFDEIDLRLDELELELELDPSYHRREPFMTRRSFTRLQPSQAGVAKGSEITPQWLLIRIVRDFVDGRLRQCPAHRCQPIRTMRGHL
jgi:hypothetical protein